MHLTLRQIEIFVAVARGGSTVAAAEAIALSQSATSASLNELERLLGARLFDRVSKRLILNEQGRLLLPQALALLDSASSLEAGFAATALSAASALRIGASTTIGNYVLPRLLAGYRERSGNLPDEALARTRVAIANAAQVAAMVGRFDVDVGLVEGPCHEPDVEAVPWLEDELLIVAAPGHALAAMARAGRVPVAALREATWLLREPGSGTREAVDQALLPYLHQMRGGIEWGNSEAIKHAAAEGLGVACLSRWVVADLLRSGDLVTIPGPRKKMMRRSYLLLHKKKHVSAGLQGLIDYCREQAQSV